MTVEIYRVAPDRDDCVQQIVTLHRQTFPGGLLSELGEAFVHRYYRLLICGNAGTAYVGLQDNEMAGFIAFAQNPAKLAEAGFFREARNLALRRVFCLRMNPLVVLRAAIKRMKSRELHHFPELLAIAVKPEYRRFGIGKLLVQQMESDLPESGITDYIVYTDNPEGASFYQKRDFETLFRFRLGGIDSYCFRKRIGHTHESGIQSFSK